MRRMGSPSAQEYASGGGDDIGSQAQIRLQRARIIALEGELATSAEESAERAAALLTAEFEVKELLAEKLAMQKALAKAEAALEKVSERLRPRMRERDELAHGRRAARGALLLKR